jgi:hypothetical protein
MIHLVLLILLFLSIVSSNDESNEVDKCFVISSFFYGNHSSSRVAIALDWASAATYPAIFNAMINYSKYDNSSYMLFQLDLYHSYSVYCNYMNDMFNSHFNVSANIDFVCQSRNEVQVNTTISESKISMLKTCNVVYISRIDGDDLLDSKFFFKMSNVSFLSKPSNAVIVAGMADYRDVLLSRSESNVTYCNITYVKRHLQMSQGQTVIMSAVHWLHEYNGKLIFGKHFSLPHTMAIRNNGRVTTTNIDDLAVYMSTQLSSHFSHLRPSIECSLSTLQNWLGYDNGKVVWDARNQIPQMSLSLFRESDWCKEGHADWKCE